MKNAHDDFLKINEMQQALTIKYKWFPWFPRFPCYGKYKSDDGVELAAWFVFFMIVFMAHELILRGYF